MWLHTFFFFIFIFTKGNNFATSLNNTTLPELEQIEGAKSFLLPNCPQKGQNCILTLLHSERSKLHTILAFLSAIGLSHTILAFLSAIGLKVDPPSPTHPLRREAKTENGLIASPESTSIHLIQEHQFELQSIANPVARQNSLPKLS